MIACKGMKLLAGDADLCTVLEIVSYLREKGLFATVLS